MGRTPRFGLVVLLAGACAREDPAATALAARVDQLERRLAVLESSATAAPPTTSTSTATASASKAIEPSIASPALEAALARHDRGDAIHLTLAEDGGVRLEGVELHPEDLDVTLRALAETSAVTRVEIVAGGGVRQAELLALVDRVRDAGLSRFAIVARGGAEDPSPFE